MRLPTYHGLRQRDAASPTTFRSTPALTGPAKRTYAPRCRVVSQQNPLEAYTNVVRSRRQHLKMTLIPVLASCMALANGCLGSAHGYRCYGADGRYFRATRMNYDVLVGREPVNESVTVRNGVETVQPGWSFPVRLPFVAIDLPFGLVLDTVLVPFIATGVVESPRPYHLRSEDVPWPQTQ